MRNWLHFARSNRCLLCESPAFESPCTRQDAEDVVIARAEKPVARLVKLEPQRKRIPGAWKGQVLVSDDSDDFNPQDERDWCGDA